MTNVIHLKDNDFRGCEIAVNETVIEDIRGVAAVNLQRLPENLLLFPQSFSDIKDQSVNKDGETSIHILTVTEDSKECTEKNSIRVFTGNIMGFVGKGNTSISIHSRFTHSDKAREDYFLYYMLGRVFNINLFNLDHTTDQDDRIMDFLLFMFPNALKNALAQGLYKEYQSRDFDDARVRGAIMVNQVIKKDTPFRGRISYRTRVHSNDNTVTQVVRHTIEHIKRHPFGAVILNNDRETKEYVDQIIMATPTYNPRDREKVLKANLRPKIHPFYLKYKDLQSLCIKILRHDSLKYGEDRDKVHGILFDGAWLWEEYLNTILADLGFNHPRNKERDGAIYMFKNPAKDVEDISNPEQFDYYSQKLYPDFYKPAKTEGRSAEIILDAKYKALDKKVSREDLFQVISYMHCMNASIGGYLYPVSVMRVETVKAYALTGLGGTMMTIPFQIPDSSTNWKDFRNAIGREEEKLKNKLLQTAIN